MKVQSFYPDQSPILEPSWALRYILVAVLSIEKTHQHNYQSGVLHQGVIPKIMKHENESHDDTSALHVIVMVSKVYHD